MAALAAVPLIFGAHQLAEGFVWHDLTHGTGTLVGTLPVYVYVLVAYTLWPVYVPLAMLAVETVRWRRRAMWACAALGSVSGAWFLRGIVAEAPVAHELARGVSYDVHSAYGAAFTVPYMLAAITACLVASHPLLRRVGMLWAAGAAVAFFLMAYDAFASTWCIFAAMMSVTIYAYVRSERPIGRHSSVEEAHPTPRS